MKLIEIITLGGGTAFVPIQKIQSLFVSSEKSYYIFLGNDYIEVSKEQFYKVKEELEK